MNLMIILTLFQVFEITLGPNCDILQVLMILIALTLVRVWWLIQTIGGRTRDNTSLGQTRYQSARTG